MFTVSDTKRFHSSSPPTNYLKTLEKRKKKVIEKKGTFQLINKERKSEGLLS